MSTDASPRQHCQHWQRFRVRKTSTTCWLCGTVVVMSVVGLFALFVTGCIFLGGSPMLAACVCTTNGTQYTCDNDITITVNQCELGSNQTAHDCGHEDHQFYVPHWSIGAMGPECGAKQLGGILLGTSLVAFAFLGLAIFLVCPFVVFCWSAQSWYTKIEG